MKCRPGAIARVEYCTEECEKGRVAENSGSQVAFLRRKATNQPGERGHGLRVMMVRSSRGLTLLALRVRTGGA